MTDLITPSHVPAGATPEGDGVITGDDLCRGGRRLRAGCGRRILEELGGSTVNIPSDVTLAELAEMRAAVSVPLDLYIESADPSAASSATTSPATW